jgi:hypothetical protein
LTMTGKQAFLILPFTRFEMAKYPPFAVESLHLMLKQGSSRNQKHQKHNIKDTSLNLFLTRR